MMIFPNGGSLRHPAFFLVILMAWLLSGCVTSAPQERWAPVTRHDGNQVHVVVWADETLPAIASWYTGSSDNAEVLANANPTLNPVSLRKGDQVFIPPRLLKTRGSMSRAFLDTFSVVPVTAMKTSSGSLNVKTPRIIVPVPYKAKKGADAEALVDAQGDMAGSAPPAASESFASPDAERVEEDEDIHLFGPK